MKRFAVNCFLYCKVVAGFQAKKIKNSKYQLEMRFYGIRMKYIEQEVIAD